MAELVLACVALAASVASLLYTRSAYRYIREGYQILRDTWRRGQL